MQAFDLEKANNGDRVLYLVCGEWLPLIAKNFKFESPTMVSYERYDGGIGEIALARLRLAKEHTPRINPRP
jgi:hypothetical protein